MAHDAPAIATSSEHDALVFLDIDGVICCNDRQQLEGDKLQNLRRICKATGAKVVLSSDWRRQMPLKQKVQRMAKQGHLPGLDGRRIRVRSEHAALNSLLQSGGALVMKRGLVYAVETLDTAGLRRNHDWALLAQVHDEYQSEALPPLAEQVGSAFVDGIRHAGDFYDMRCPLDGECMIGNNWAETH